MKTLVITEIKIEESEEKDILILEPPKLINFKYDDTLNILPINHLPFCALKTYPLCFTYRSS